ncbi:MAG: hypothetical protein IIC55_06340 [Proteobacteria bacterium]|nr:hypothetical protein [Pseudomonadota bacterium]
MCRQRAVEHLHHLGPPACYHALIEVADGNDLDGTLARYRRIDPGMLRALGGGKFPDPPIYAVPSS